MKKIIFSITSLIMISFLTGCGSGYLTAQIGDNTFVYNSKVYKIVDNELTEIADLNSKSIRKFEVSKAKQKIMGADDLSYIKNGASGYLTTLYRGNYLYYKLALNNFNDLKENYTSGIFTIEFEDEFGFILHSIEIRTNELTGILGDGVAIEHYEFNGKTEMSTDINEAISTFSISSTVKLNTSNYKFNY